MTTLAALSTKDALIMGCDSLGSVTRTFVDPIDLIPFFGGGPNFEHKLDENGKPLLGLKEIFGKTRDIPYNHMTYVDKLFSLEPLPMGVMITGIASIGNYTIKNLINQFKSKEQVFKKTGPKHYTVHSIASKILKFMKEHYDKTYGTQQTKPSLEMIIGGYDKPKHIPTIFRIHVHENKVENTIDDFGIVFGGQMTEIQRIVFGTDNFNRLNLMIRNNQILNQYYEEISAFLKNNKFDIDIPKPDIINKYNLFLNWSLTGFAANWGDFSEKNAIECVKFFIDVMVKTQQFSNTMPTVGGDIHLAIITKADGFKFCYQPII
jgi:hypothetical protein